ncbi:hypothetical protein [Rhizobium dioscoreae]|uniref:hypothetical protein n=1 Tax=Rhizobium dioscoreae TaxID=2653122 RepID=UPI001260CDBC|nr:hypothetical protein [Rhizobium dioscoreae]
MNRREMLFISTAAVATLPLASAKAQNLPLVLPTHNEVARIVGDDTMLERMLVAVDALRLNLLLTREDFTAAYASAHDALKGYEDIKRQVREGAKILRGKVASGEEKMEKLGGRLQEHVQSAASYLVKAGLQEGSKLYEEQVTSFWSFLYIVTESGQQTVDAIGRWICGSNPFDVLESCKG